MRIQYLVILTLASAMLVFASGCKQKPDEPGALAEVGGEQITRGDLLYEMKRHPLATPATDRQAAAMEELLRRKRMVAAARQHGLAERPEVRRAIDGILIKLLIEQELQPQLDEIAVSDNEVAEAYEATREKFAEPASKTLAILFRKSREADVVRRREHREALVRAVDEVRVAGIPAAQGFGKISVRNSEHQASRYRGGLVEPLVEGMAYRDFQAALIEASKNLQPGEFTEVIERPEGLYVARLAGARAARQRPLESVRTKIRRDLLAAREAQVREDFHRQLLAEFPAAVREMPAELEPSADAEVRRLLSASQ